MIDASNRRFKSTLQIDASNRRFKLTLRCRERATPSHLYNTPTPTPTQINPHTNGFHPPPPTHTDTGKLNSPLPHTHKLNLPGGGCEWVGGRVWPLRGTVRRLCFAVGRVNRTCSSDVIEMKRH